MIWNWQQPEWPNFSYNAQVLEPLERKFLLMQGKFSGGFTYFSDARQQDLMIEILGEEALQTSAIEGEILNGDSVQA